MLRKDIFGGSQQPDNTDRTNRIIAGTEINGDLTSDTNIHLEGEVNGNVSCAGRVIIGTSGKINGNLVCVNAEIDGAMDGQLMVENLLVLRSTARIKGDITNHETPYRRRCFLRRCLCHACGCKHSKARYRSSVQ